MSTSARSLLYLCFYPELNVLLLERINRALPDVEARDFLTWVQNLPETAAKVALISDSPEYRSVDLLAAQIKQVCPDCRIFVYGNNPHQLIARTPDVEQVFSAGYDEDLLIDALRQAFAD